MASSASSKRTHEVYVISDDDTPASVATPAKRACLQPDPALWNMITTLSAAKLQSTVYQACQQSPGLVSLIRNAHAEQVAEQAAAEAAKPPINFDYYSKSCWHALNSKYRSMGGSRQYDGAYEVSDQLDSVRRSIMKQARNGTRWETRRNALEVLRKISKSVMLCEVQIVRHELMKDGMLLGGFAKSMVKLAKNMSQVERQRYRDEGLYEKLVDLQNEDEDIDINMEGLRKVYAVFDGYEVSDDGQEDEFSSEEDENFDDDDFSD